jgi:RNA 2',3'-cyclic 3'-phosphodiesterase
MTDAPAGTERLFVALDPPAALRDQLARRAAAVARGIGGRPTPADKLHVTLAFLGAVPEDRISAVERQLHHACRGHRPIVTRTAGTAGVPRAARSRIVAAALEDADGAIAALAADIGAAVAPLAPGFRPTTPFWPHVTLARLRRPSAVAATPTDTEQMFAFDRVTLYASRSAPGGTARYVPLAHIALTRSDRDD